MNKLATVLATLAVVIVGCLAENIISIEKDDGTIVSQDLDKPSSPVTYAVDPSQLKFMLYTSKSKSTPQQIKLNDVNSLKNSNFDASKPTRFLIHGWQGSYEGKHIQVIKDAYCDNLNVNVIMADYEPFAKDYNKACNDAKTIAGFFAQFLQFLVNNGMRMKDLHIIGHSLGAHIAGFCANNMGSTVPRITGMDPAGPNFQKAGPEDRLSPDDATFVDILHTSTAYGMEKSIGTVDFYPNGGQGQPKCSGILSGGCDHTEACQYYASSVTNPKSFPATKCKSESDAKQTKPSNSACSASSAYMGEPAMATAAPGIYHVAF